jgi:hypothetical protein
LLICAALLLSAVSLKFLRSPFVWIGWGWVLTLFFCAWYLKTGFARVLIFNAAMVIAFAAAGETYLAAREFESATFSGPYFKLDDVLGTVAIPGEHVQSSRSLHGKPEYNVIYTTDSNGLRITPPARATGLEGSLLFFGCSFTFGEGLNDDETMPYQVGILSGGRYQVYNFGFQGYAPNQMLAAIESGRVRQIVQAPPRYAIYQAIPDHVARVAGKIPYGKHSPRYRLGADGNASRDGHFDDGQKFLTGIEARLQGQLRKSAIYQTFASAEPRTNDNDVRLLLALVRKSKDLLSAEYPGIEFHVILWRNFDFEKDTYRELLEGFSKMNIPVHQVENILPGYNTAPEKYFLSTFDRHPNALADRLIAKYIVSQILDRNSQAPPPN